MRSNVRRRYYFILKNVITSEYIKIRNFFELEDQGRENYLLSSIDNFTLNFSNEDELKAYLNQHLNIGYNYSKIFIKYKEKKKNTSCTFYIMICLF